MFHCAALQNLLWESFVSGCYKKNKQRMSVLLWSFCMRKKKSWNHTFYCECLKKKLLWKFLSLATSLTLPPTAASFLCEWCCIRDSFCVKRVCWNNQKYTCFSLKIIFSSFEIGLQRAAPLKTNEPAWITILLMQFLTQCIIELRIQT